MTLQFLPSGTKGCNMYNCDGLSGGYTGGALILLSIPILYIYMFIYIYISCINIEPPASGV